MWRSVLFLKNLFFYSRLRPKTFTVFSKLVFFLLFSILVALIYSNTLNSPFYFDDQQNIVDNPDIRLKILTLKDIVKSRIFIPNERFFSSFTFAINYYFGEYNPFGYHLVNIIIHIINGILLFLLIRITYNMSFRSSSTYKIYNQPQTRGNILQYENATIIAFSAAVFWAVNPLHTNSVTYIVQRMNSMAAMFYLTSMLCYINGRITLLGLLDRITPETSDSKPLPGKWYLWFTGSVLSWIIALSCKQTTATLPFFIILYEFYFFQNLSINWLKRNIKYFIFIFILFSLTAFIYLGLNPVEKLSSINDFAKNEFTYAERVLTQPRVVLYYISLIFFPHPSRLNLDYDFPLSHSLFSPVTTFISLFMIVILIAGSLLIAKKERLISFCMIWFFGNLVIESSVIPLAIIFEHRTYLPSMLICLIPVMVLYRLIKSPKWPVMLLCLVITIFSFWTYQRNRVWENALTLWEDCVKKSPNKARPYNNLGKALAEADRKDEAAKHFLKAIQLNPNFAEAHNNLGNLLVDDDKIQEAVNHYFAALKINPEYAEAHNNIGNAIVKLGRPEEAISHYSKALKIDPNLGDVHYNMGIALAKQGNHETAIKHYKKALFLSPHDATIHNSIGVSLLTQNGKETEAVNQFKIALELNPSYEEAHINLGQWFAKNGKIEAAVECYTVALKINPNLKDIHYNIGVLYSKQGKTNQSIQHFSEAVRLDPDFIEAHVHLANALVRIGDLDMALTHISKVLNIKPDYAEMYFFMGTIFNMQNKTEQAINSFYKALQINPDYTDARNAIQKALLIKRNAYIAEEEKIRQELKEDPNNINILFRIGNLYLQNGEKNKAITQYQKVLSIQPDFIPALTRLTNIYITDGHYDKSIFFLKKIIELEPNNSIIYYNIACLYARQNKTVDAITWLKKAIDKGYDNWKLIETDKDLNKLRENMEYRKLIEHSKN